MLVLPTLPTLGVGQESLMHTFRGEQEGIKLLSSILRAGQPSLSPSSVCIPQDPQVFASP